MSLHKPMTKEESYVQRRELFKKIWDTAMLYNGKEDILAKPKVIKTLRMDDIDNCPVGKSKKEQIKNLRSVCNRILEFCKQQDADDKVYGRAASTRGAGKSMESPTTLSPVRANKPKKVTLPKERLKKKLRIANSMTMANIKSFLPNTSIVERFSVGNKTILSRKTAPTTTDRNISPNRSTPQSSLPVKKSKRKSIIKRKPYKVKIQNTIERVDFPKEPIMTKRKVLNKKRHGCMKKKNGLQTSPRIICV